MGMPGRVPYKSNLRRIERPEDPVHHEQHNSYVPEVPEKEHSLLNATKKTKRSKVNLELDPEDAIPRSNRSFASHSRSIHNDSQSQVLPSSARMVPLTESQNLSPTYVPHHHHDYLLTDGGKHGLI